MSGTRRTPAPELPPCGDWYAHGKALRTGGTCTACDEIRRRRAQVPPLSPAGERFPELPPPPQTPEKEE